MLQIVKGSILIVFFFFAISFNFAQDDEVIIIRKEEKIDKQQKVIEKKTNKKSKQSQLDEKKEIKEEEEESSTKTEDKPKIKVKFSINISGKKIDSKFIKELIAKTNVLGKITIRKKCQDDTILLEQAMTSKKMLIDLMPVYTKLSIEKQVKQNISVCFMSETNVLIEKKFEVIFDNNAPITKVLAIKKNATLPFNLELKCNDNHKCARTFMIITNINSGKVVKKEFNHSKKNNKIEYLLTENVKYKVEFYSTDFSENKEKSQFYDISFESKKNATSNKVYFMIDGGKTFGLLKDIIPFSFGAFAGYEHNIDKLPFIKKITKNRRHLWMPLMKAQLGGSLFKKENTSVMAFSILLGPKFVFPMNKWFHYKIMDNLSISTEFLSGVTYMIIKRTEKDIVDTTSLGLTIHPAVNFEYKIRSFLPFLSIRYHYIYDEIAPLHGIHVSLGSHFLF